MAKMERKAVESIAPIKMNANQLREFQLEEVLPSLDDTDKYLFFCCNLFEFLL